MTANLDDIATLTELKSECRIDADDDSQNSMLTLHRDAAIAYVEKSLSRPLIDANIKRYAPRLGDDKPMWVKNLPDYKNLVSVKYWLPTDNHHGDPTGEYNLETLGRIDHQDNFDLFIHPPADGWVKDTNPMEANLIEVVAACGIDFDGHAAANLKQAVLMVAQKIYDAEPYMDSVNTLLAPWRRYDR